jgi:hypothetical protein
MTGRRDMQTCIHGLLSRQFYKLTDVSFFKTENNFYFVLALNQFSKKN